MNNADIYVKFWGVRGSVPTPISPKSLEDKIIHLLMGSHGRDVSTPKAALSYLNEQSVFQRTTIGGNTSCVEVRAGDQHFVFDCGSGLKELGWSLMKEAFGKGQGKIQIFMSHTHWDHILGFPFFVPAYIPGNEITIYGAHSNLKKRFTNQHHPYNFPQPLSIMRSNIQFKKLTPDRQKHFGKVTVKPILLDHPGDSYAYRIEYNNHVFVYASDGAYNNPSPEVMEKFHLFYQNADLRIFDAFFDLIESFEKNDWGHSTSFLGVDIALKAGVKNLLLFHHAPLSDDWRLGKFLEGTRRYLNHVAPNTDLKVDIAYEGLVCTL